MDGIWKTLGIFGVLWVSIRLTTDISYDARDDKRDEQDETLVFTRIAGICNPDQVRLTGDQLQKDIRSWLSPPDPSKNHNIARGAHHSGTAEWFTQGDIFEKWMASDSLLWVHGKRMHIRPHTLILLMDAGHRIM